MVGTATGFGLAPIDFDNAAQLESRDVTARLRFLLSTEQSPHVTSTQARWERDQGAKTAKARTRQWWSSWGPNTFTCCGAAINRQACSTHDRCSGEIVTSKARVGCEEQLHMRQRLSCMSSESCLVSGSDACQAVCCLSCAQIAPQTPVTAENSRYGADAAA